MSSTADLINEFYQAFSRRDGEAMAKLYAPEAEFSDPVFPNLRGEEIGAMWRMLCERGKDLEIEFTDVSADGDSGRATWDAHYTFSATGRKVHNHVQATFRFSDDKIVEHRDDFGFWRWSRQALGLPGVLLGWTPMIQGTVQRNAATALAAYRKLS